MRINFDGLLTFLVKKKNADSLPEINLFLLGIFCIATSVILFQLYALTVVYLNIVINNLDKKLKC